MPRRIYNYRDTDLLAEYNLISTAGSYIMGVGILIFIVNVFWSRKGRRRGRRTTRGWRTRSSGIRPRRRRRTTSTRFHT